MAETVSSSVERTARRACDRCSRLKTQCDFTDPCARCRRLGLDCTMRRPVRQRGRPKRRTVGGSESRTNEVTSPFDVEDQLMNDDDLIPLETNSNRALSPDAINSVLRKDPGSDVNPNLAAALLQRLFSLGEGLGIYSVFFTGVEASLDIRSSDSEGLSGIEMDSEVVLHKNDAHPWTPQLVYGLLAVALEINSRSVLDSRWESSQLDKDSLRTNSLNLLPRMTWIYQPLVTDALVLLSYSWTWCFTEHLSHMSLRWYMMARLMFEETGRKDSLSSRVEIGMDVQGLSLSLLLFRDDLSTSKTPQISVPAEINAAHPPCSYWGLFRCLRSAFGQVLQEPVIATRTWHEARMGLEDFFFDFPTNLLRFDNIENLYQAEFMVWMHGLFILLYTKRDLLDILLNPSILTDETLPRALDHSLLLGEVLPTFQRLESRMEMLSAITVYFVLLSSTVHAAALLSCSLGDEASTSGEAVPVPPKLAGSSWTHLGTLTLIESCCKRYDLPIVGEIRKLLAAAYGRAVHGSHGADGVDAKVLMLYRWKGRGAGILRLDPDTAESEWGFPQPPNVDILGLVPRHGSQCHRLLAELCSSKSRLSKPGYFDMSILV
nr:uncharacterized protein CTRU02_00590 [Colletotrichum truncatum]KAF6801841.1 hypothetical protein CTRU02_00590 [Colletotrichum truncatum]